LNHPTKELLLIFTRNPELGKCKTRLAATIGDVAALQVYKFLLEHTAKTTEGLTAKKVVYYSEEIWKEDVWDNAIFEKKLQQGIDLGERMYNAFKTGFKDGFEKIIIIGSDLFDITPQDLEMAFGLLDTTDFVIGPAEDGGYYLLGMKIAKPSLFTDKAWGTGTVLRDTLKNLEDENHQLLKTKNDVDVYEDIAHNDAFKPFLKHVKK